MAVRAFVDTNVLIRALVPAMAQHEASEALLRRFWSVDTELWISGQVIREFIVQVTHPNTLTVPLTISEAIDTLNQTRVLFEIADETAAVRSRLLDLLIAYPTRGKQVHDANIVATMLVYDIAMLITMNTSDFKRFIPGILLVSPASETT